jgi:hypothetical protein
MGGVGDYVDDYCERTGPGLWGEPFNSVSNLAFLVAAIALWVLLRRSRGLGDRPAQVAALPVLVALIFLGSTVFHLVATGWGASLDSGFIGVFLLYYVALYAHLFGPLPWRLAWLATPVFLVFTVVVSLVARALDLAAPGMYLAAFLGLVAMAGLLFWSRRPELRPAAWEFVVAAELFAVSLAFRTIDSSVCGLVPVGTHFLWHLLNGATLYLVSRTAIRAWAGASVPR